MEPRNVLIYFAFIHKGDWVKISDSLFNKNDEWPSEEKIMKTIKSVKSKALTILDKEYPENLKTVYRPPFVLFYHGDISLLTNTSKIIGVVGTRKCDDYGIAMTQKLVKGISKYFVVISGMAKGIDAVAHQQAIDSGGKTICVLGCGINYCYPPDNLDLYLNAKKNHLVISEYPNSTPPHQRYFPIRNRIIAGACRCLLVTQGKKMSGTSITAGLAADYGADVCCVPARADEDSVCNELISTGAYLVETVKDIFETIYFDPGEELFKNEKNVKE